MDAWRLYYRNQRLRRQEMMLINEKELEKLQNKENSVPTDRLPKITGMLVSAPYEIPNAQANTKDYLVLL